MHRRPLASLFSALLALALPATFAACGGNVIVDEPSGGGGPCEDGLSLCFGACVDLYSDPSNCGECNTYCTGICKGGNCTSGEDCPKGLTDCGNGCVDLNSDSFNCGYCNNQCPLDAVCAGGGCQISECFCGGICFIEGISSNVPQSITGTTKGQSNQVGPICADSGGADRTFAFSVPFDADYTFDTFGSSFDTVLQVMDNGCGVIGCNDDAGGGGPSSLTVFLVGGQQVLIVVDTLAGDGDFFQLNINAGGSGECVTCSEAIIDNPNQLPTCEGISTKLYDSLISCVCADACAFQCADNVCVGMDISPECQGCVPDTVNGCGNQFNDCSNDF